jgi:hypothetical protein
MEAKVNSLFLDTDHRNSVIIMLLFQQKFNDLAIGVIFFTGFISYYELKIYCKDYITWSKIILSFLYFGSKV